MTKLSEREERIILAIRCMSTDDPALRASNLRIAVKHFLYAEPGLSYADALYDGPYWGHFHPPYESEVVNKLNQETKLAIILGLQDNKGTFVALFNECIGSLPGNYAFGNKDSKKFIKDFIVWTKLQMGHSKLNHKSFDVSRSFYKAMLKERAECYDSVSFNFRSDHDKGYFLDKVPTEMSTGKKKVSEPTTKGKESGMEIKVEVDEVLKEAGLPTKETIQKHERDVKKLQKDLEELEKQVDFAPKPVSLEYVFNGSPSLEKSGNIPSGQYVMKKAFEVFPIPEEHKDYFNFDVPCFEWDGEHPLVPNKDEHYQFQLVPLVRVLWAIIGNKKAWLAGHTGTGKSTLVEQVAAHLNYPLRRVNFDSEITRMDLIGRDTLKTVDGKTITKFEEGILPQALSSPCILLCDEMDFIRPDVAYVMQRALEDKGLMLTEDGGRIVEPDPMMRLIATGNTKGNGDNTGRYMGARPQSGAFLDRFTCWVDVDYMTEDSLKELITSKSSELKEGVVDTFVKYAKEHWVGFKNGDIGLPLSPRGILATVEAYEFFTGLMPHDEAISRAFKMSVSDRTDESDQQAIEGLIQRVTKTK